MRKKVIVDEECSRNSMQEEQKAVVHTKAAQCLTTSKAIYIYIYIYMLAHRVWSDWLAPLGNNPEGSSVIRLLERSL
jgi:hypothetical protein